MMKSNKEHRKANKVLATTFYFIENPVPPLPYSQ